MAIKSGVFIFGAVLATYCIPAHATDASLTDIRAERLAAEQRVKELRLLERTRAKLDRACEQVRRLGGTCADPSVQQPATLAVAPPVAPAPSPAPVAVAAVAAPQGPPAPAAPPPAVPVKADAAGVATKSLAELTQEAKVADATEKFGGIELGAGLSFTLDVGEHDRVSEAEYINGLVRIKNADNTRARIMLESHYFFKPPSRFLGLLDEGMWGVGPFVAIQPGSDNIVEAIGLGAMIGFRRAEDKPESFNIGIGFVVDPNVQILGDGILPNKPLPSGETEIRFKNDSQSGIMAIASFSF